jgi:hypothetical protein
MQQLIVILIVAGSAAWLGWQAFRYFRPKAGGRACAGGCCDGEEKPAVRTASAAPGTRTMMITSDDLRARIAARKT